jgi:hypothetical protein
MILGEGAVKLRLEHGGVLPGLYELFLQGLRLEYCVTVSLEHVRFLSGSLHDILQESTVSPYPWSMSDFCRGLSTTSCKR